jgi:NADH dehydrogenase
MAEVEAFDPGRRRLQYRVQGSDTTDSLAYDHLVLAPGSVTRMPDIRGLADHGFEMKSLSDAVKLRDHAIRQLERADACHDPALRASMLHFVVVGANFTGVEVAGEFDVFLRRASRKYANVRSEEISVTVLELGTRILPALDEDLSDYAMERMRSRGMAVELETSVAVVAADHVVLTDGRRLPTETVIWCAGIAPSPLVGRFQLPRDDVGYITCDRDLRVSGYSDVWAIGDSAVNPGPDGRPYPATAQHAVQQAGWLARNVVRVLRGRSPQACDLTSKGSLAALGCRTGVAKVFGFKLSGFPAWFLWRTVYLMKMPGWSRRIRVALDWTMDLLFPRDVVQLGLARSQPPTGSSQGSADIGPQPAA